MNAKRQTIWLVSMLSLMVVLSAYYLFTEDSAKVDMTTASGSLDSTAAAPVTLDLKDPKGAKVDSKDSAKVEVKLDPNQQTAQAGAKSDAKTDAKTGAKTGAAAPDVQATSSQTAAQADKAGQAKTDAQVLDKMTSAALSGSDYFADQQLKRDEEISKQTEALMAITSNSKESAQNLEKAYNDLEKLQDMNTKMLNLETELTKQFPNAVVTKDGEKYKVAVQAQKLTPSQAVSIVDLTMQEMSVGQDKVIVQYLP
jgi:stage III sporulation protein AH